MVSVSHRWHAGGITHPFCVGYATSKHYYEHLPVLGYIEMAFDFGYDDHHNKMHDFEECTDGDDDELSTDGVMIAVEEGTRND